jgi:hypothetical protein
MLREKDQEFKRSLGYKARYCLKTKTTIKEELLCLTVSDVSVHKRSSQQFALQRPRSRKRIFMPVLKLAFSSSFIPWRIQSKQWCHLIQGRSYSLS